MAAPFEIIERSSTLPVSAEEAFAWHERPGAFERLTPPWERVTVLERSGGIREGARTAVSVRVGPARFRWVAVHRDYVEGRRFVDEQVEGPFSHWIHEHRFEPEGPGATRYTDRIELGPAFGTGRCGSCAPGWRAPGWSGCWPIVTPSSGTIWLPMRATAMAHDSEWRSPGPPGSSAPP